MSYNLKSLGAEPAALARIVRRMQPDVLIAQEAPKGLRWRPKCAAFARECGMLYLAGGRSAGGNMLLVTPRVDVAASDERRIPQPLGDPIRGVVSATVGLAGRWLGVLGTHLGLRRANRAAQVRDLVHMIDHTAGMPVVVAGDFNETPDGPSWEALGDAGLVDPGDPEGSDPSADEPTFPADIPRTRIDGILVSKELDVVEYGIPRDHAIRADLRVATDHLPVFCVLDLPA